MDDNPRIAELRKKIEKDPGSRLFAQLAEELRKDGRHTDAIAVARGGLDKNPNYPSARLTLARALLDSGKPGEARPELEGIVAVSPDNILASRLLGEALEDLGDIKGAAQQIERTLKISPGDKGLVEKLALLKAGLNRVGEQAKPSAPPAPLMMPSSAAVVPPIVWPAPTPAPSIPPPPVAASVALDRDLASGTFSPGSLNAQDLQKQFDSQADVDETLGFGDLVAPAPPPPQGATTTLLPLQAGAGSEEMAPAATGAGAPEPSADLPAVMAGHPVAEPPVEVPGDDVDVGAQTLPLTSLTLADLYLQQGLKTEASAVLSQVLREEPENRQAQSRFAAVSREIAAAAVIEPADHFSEPVATALAQVPMPEMKPSALEPPATSPAPGAPVLEAAEVSASAPRNRAEIGSETIRSLKAFLSAVEREAVHQRATETPLAPTGAPTP